MKYFLLKMFWFLTIIFILQFSIGKIFTSQNDTSERLNFYLTNNYRVLYFGDSVVKFISPQDKDTHSIVEMLTILEPDIKIGDMSHPAYGVDMYEAITKRISLSNKKPQKIIIPINLGSFSVASDKRPEYQFEKEKFILKSPFSSIQYFYKPLVILKGIDLHTVTHSEFEKTIIYNKEKIIGTAGDLEAIRLNESRNQDDIKNLFIYQYLYTLSPNHRKLIALSQLLSLTQKEGIETFIYIMPINYEAGSKNIPDFIERVKSNSDMICDVVTLHDMDCHHLEFNLNSRYFVNNELPDDHLNQNGRQYIARYISDNFFKR